MAIMKKFSKSIERFQNMLEQGPRKRKRSNSCKGENLPPAKRRRMMVVVPRTFLRKCREWHERRRKIALGIILYLDAQMRDTRRMSRKRLNCELFADYEGIPMSKYTKFETTSSQLSPVPSSSSSLSVATIAASLSSADKLKANVTNEIAAPAPKRGRLIKRLPDNVAADDPSEVKVTPVQRRGAWRKKGEKRF